MLLLKFTFVFFCCAFGYPLDVRALRAKIMIASNFYGEGEREIGAPLKYFYPSDFSKDYQNAC